jgi:hypothetical protein
MIDKYDAVSNECWRMMLLESGEVNEITITCRRASALS